MGYQKNSDDNGRVGGTFNDFTTEHVIGKFRYGEDVEADTNTDENVSKVVEED